jgi:hypothetical protein
MAKRVPKTVKTSPKRKKGKNVVKLSIKKMLKYK